MRHLAYCEGVVSGEIVAGEYIRLACKRTLEDHRNPPTMWTYDQRYVDRFLKFAAKCRHVEGELAGQPFELAPWQLWIISEGYGWRNAANPRERRFVDVIAQIARKNGKTTFAAVIGLFETRFGDAGSQVYSVATKQDQAKICWDAAFHMVPSLPAHFDMSTLIGKLEIKGPGASKFKPLSKETKSLDGLNPQLGIVDEAAAIEDRNVIEVLSTALGARVAPWMLYITTAQPMTTTLYYERRAAALAMLKGEIQAPRMFAAIYEVDEGDDPLTDEACWPKANPNLGVSVRPSFLRKQVADALTTPSMKSNVLCKNFNVWAKAASAWMPRAKWDACKGEVLRRGDCFIGVDLAQTTNLAAVSRTWVNGRNLRSIDFRFFLPYAALAEIPKDLAYLYDAAQASGILTVTDGMICDYGTIGSYIERTCDEHDVERIGFDPWNAAEMLTRLQNEGLPVLIVRQSMQQLSAPSKALEAAILAKHVRHDGDPFVAWQFENTLASIDDRHNLKLFRDVGHPERQVDAVTAAVTGWAGLLGRMDVEGYDDDFEEIDETGDASAPPGHGVQEGSVAAAFW